MSALCAYQISKPEPDRWINTSSKKVRQAFEKWWYERQQTMSETLRKSGVDHVSVTTDEDYVAPLMNLFKKELSDEPDK